MLDGVQTVESLGSAPNAAAIAAEKQVFTTSAISNACATARHLFSPAWKARQARMQTEQDVRSV